MANRLTDEQVAVWSRETVTNLSTREPYNVALHLNALAREVQHYRRIEASLRAWHRTEVAGEMGGTRYWCDCLECGGTWSCPTIRLLDGGDA